MEETVTITMKTKKQSLKSKSLWRHAFDSLKRNRMAMISLSVVSFYMVIALLSLSGVIASDWAKEVGPAYDAPFWVKWINGDEAPFSMTHFFGTDILGRSVFLKMIKGTEVAMFIGFATGLITMVIGVFLGAIAGYFGGKVDEGIVWFYTTFSSIPSIMLLMAITFILGKGIVAVFLALGLTSWVSLCRLIRADVIRHKNREYVAAAFSVGASHTRRLFIHILPNVFHLVIINFSLTFQMAIKSEVILSYLGLGVQERPSWGIMIDDAKLELARGVWWQLLAATLGMFVIVLAFNILGDALRDALDPKLKGK